MSDVSKLKFKNGSYNIKDTQARNEINNLNQKIVTNTNQLDQKINTNTNQLESEINNLNHKIDTNTNQLESEIINLDSQLVQKASRTEVFLKEKGININDLDEDTRGIILDMEPGEINAVLGLENVKTENIMSGAITQTKLNENVSNLIYTTSQGNTVVEDGQTSEINQVIINRDPFTSDGFLSSVSFYSKGGTYANLILFSENRDNTLNVENVVPIIFEGGIGIKNVQSNIDFTVTPVKKGWLLGFQSFEGRIARNTDGGTHYALPSGIGVPDGKNIVPFDTTTNVSMNWVVITPLINQKRDKLVPITRADVDETMKPSLLDAFDIIQEASINLFNKEEVTNGGFYNKDGDWVVSSGGVSGKVKVFPGRTYTKSLEDPVTQISYYGVRDEYIVGFDLGVGVKTFTVPNDERIYYAQVVAQVEYLDSWMVVEGSEYPNYFIPFQPEKYRANERLEVNAITNQDRSIQVWHLSDELMKMLMVNEVNGVTGVKANASTPLNITTYPEGQNQPIHPKVLYFEDGLFNHKYWMAYTPYPFNNDVEENPCVAFSDDGRNWSSEGISNPLDRPSPEEEGSNYYNDTHLVYRKDTGVLEIWYRKAYGVASDGFSAGTEVIYRQTTSDGLNWGNKEVLYHETSGNLASAVSPTAIYDGSKYQIWVANRYDTRGEIRYFESSDGTDWVYKHHINLGASTQTERIWHMDIIRTDLGYELVGNNIGSSGTDEYLQFYSRSKDNVNYHKPIKILGTGSSGSFDSNVLHRASLVQVGNSQRLYYSGRGSDQSWGIGLIEVVDENISQLHKLMWK